MFWNLQIIKNLIRGKNQLFGLEIDLHKFQVFGSDPIGRYEASYERESESFNEETL